MLGPLHLKSERTPAPLRDSDKLLLLSLSQIGPETEEGLSTSRWGQFYKELGDPVAAPPHMSTLLSTGTCQENMSGNKKMEKTAFL